MSVLELNVSRTASVTRTAQTLYSVNEMRLSGWHEITCHTVTWKDSNETDIDTCRLVLGFCDTSPESYSRFIASAVQLMSSYSDQEDLGKSHRTPRQSEGHILISKSGRWFSSRVLLRPIPLVLQPPGKNHVDLSNWKLAYWISIILDAPHLAQCSTYVWYVASATRALWGHHKTMMPLILRSSLYYLKPSLAIWRTVYAVNLAVLGSWLLHSRRFVSNKHSDRPSSDVATDKIKLASIEWKCSEATRLGI